VDRIAAALLTKALDGLALRGSAIAENIANAATPAYRPVRVNFEQALRSAAGGGLAAIDAVHPTLETFGAADTLRLDLQLADAAQTAQRYGAVAEILNRQLQLDGLAITGNG
jgi:flagellar basal-body rod protein FlgB